MPNKDQKIDKNPWQINSSQKIYENPWITVNEYQVLTPGGSDGIYGTVAFKNIAIGILPIDENMNTWLVGQYRFPLKKWSWEIPEGGGKLDVDPILSAKRELLEETGLKAENWQEWLKMHLSNSVSDEFSITYLATGISQHASQPEDTEELIVKKTPLDQAYKMALNGEITDSISVAALFKAKLLLF